MAIQIDLRDLRYFEAIAELGHLGRAAEQLHLTQPALTRCIRRLELMFGTELFERAGRGIRLTSAGEALLARARRLHVAADETAREMVDFARGDSGHIKLGIVPTAAQFLLPPVCRALLAETQDVSVKTVIAQDDVLTPSLKSGDLDLMISFGGPADDDLDAYVIAEDVMVVAASRSHEVLRRKPRPRMNDLLLYRWVLAAPSVESRRWLDSAFDAHALGRPVPQIETNLVTLMPRLIEQTSLLTFISRRHLAVSGIGAALKEVPVKETTMRRALKVMHRKDAYLPPAARRLVALVRKSGRALLQEA
jgi:DNA-binding transcriptional LysR family regulator